MVDYTIWDLRKAFTPREAAHLWFDIDPNAKEEIPEDVRLKIKAMEGVIDELPQYDFPYEDESPFAPDKFTREELEAYAKERKEKPPFLFPGERKSRDGRHDINKQVKGTGFTPSPDFRSINKDGKNFILTSKQAQVIQMLFQAQQKGTSDLGQDHILEEVSPHTSTKRLRDIFKSNPEAWQALIESGRKGTFRLKR